MIKIKQLLTLSSERMRLIKEYRLAIENNTLDRSNYLTKLFANACFSFLCNSTTVTTYNNITISSSEDGLTVLISFDNTKFTNKKIILDEHICLGITIIVQNITNSTFKRTDVTVASSCKILNCKFENCNDVVIYSKFEGMNSNKFSDSNINVLYFSAIYYKEVFKATCKNCIITNTGGKYFIVSKDSQSSTYIRCYIKGGTYESCKFHGCVLTKSKFSKAKTYNCKIYGNNLVKINFNVNKLVYRPDDTYSYYPIMDVVPNRYIYTLNGNTND